MSSDFTVWGHNCFLIETDSEALLIDPWLNGEGAFFGSWHQWPPNGHLREVVRERCDGKKLSIFVSHEHQDHFDKSTLAVFSDHADCTVSSACPTSAESVVHNLSLPKQRPVTGAHSIMPADK